MDGVSLVVTILSALLASAVLMIFIENQHIAANVVSRYQMIMLPFMHKLSNYFKYVYNVRHTIRITNKNDCVTDYVNLLKKFDKYSFDTTMSGKDYSIGCFSSVQIGTICDDISKVRYLYKKYQIERTGSYMLDKLPNYEITNSYLCEIFPKLRYDESSLQQLADVSGKFYDELYQPIQNYPPRYELWQKKDRQFKWLTFGNIIINAAFLIITLFFGDCICNYVTKSFAVISLILLVFTVWKMVRMEKFSTQMFQ